MALLSDMGVIGGNIGYQILKLISSGTVDDQLDGNGSDQKSDVRLGAEFWREIIGKTVIDFGCGPGIEAVEMARRGARKVIGLDIQEEWLRQARDRASKASVSDRCAFVTKTDERADVIVSLDAFEHFEDPVGVLTTMRELLKPDGCVLANFGPTWYHPLGGHLFSVFPWAHLLFTEKALIRWRSDFKTDGAARFGEVAGGLNQMTIRRFERLIDESPFQFVEFEAVPIRKLQPLANRLTREVTTSIVRCKLVPRD
ncbi:MAG: class I SAM-dependent methyltransferase [Pyrinomonadaceae bacterium]